MFWEPGLVDSKTGLPTLDKAELLGALMGLAKVSDEDPRREDWKRVGKEKLASNSKSSNVKQPVAEPA